MPALGKADNFQEESAQTSPFTPKSLLNLKKGVAPFKCLFCERGVA
jgi:hypothetical protein